MQKTKTQKGITLIALVITIIVMLILVGVTVTVALNGGLFTTAKRATADTELQRDKELEIANVSSGMTTQDLINKYKGTNQSEGSGGEDSGDDDDTGVTVPATYKTSIEGLATGVTLVPYEDLETETSSDIKAGVDAGKINAVLKEGERIAVVPTGYTVSTKDGEDSISEGLVIYDGASESSRNNEFVWIPVTTDFTETYSAGTSELEPTELAGAILSWEVTVFETADSQETLDDLYGEGYYDYPETAEEKANVNNTFAYAAHYAEMVDSVNTYNGFYIGRYETTINGTNIGSEEGKTVLTTDTILKQGNSSFDTDGDGVNDQFHYRWWGLYAAQRNSNVEGNGTTVQTNMIWGQQWEAMLLLIDDGIFAFEKLSELSTPESLQVAGATKYKYTSEDETETIISDEQFNIYDLKGNATEWTAGANNSSPQTPNRRNSRGGSFVARGPAYVRATTRPDDIWQYAPNNPWGYPIVGFSSRIALYIK